MPEWAHSISHRLLGCSLAICLMLVPVLPSPVFKVRLEPAGQSKLHSAHPKDSFCSAESCPRQVLVKLRHCEQPFDLASINRRLAIVAKGMMQIDQIAMTPVASGCIFLARSPKKSVEELMSFFQVLMLRKAETNRLLQENDLDQFEVEHAEPNFRIRLDVENSTGSHSSSSGALSWWFSDAFPGIDAVTAWKKFGKGSGVVVGVLDTGIYEHPNLVSNLWRADKPFNLQVADRVVHCEEGTYGFNVLATDSKGVCLPNDGKGHGTHVAGIIGASDHLRFGPLGVNAKVELMALKIANQNGETCMSNVLKALDFAVAAQEQLGVNLRVLNNSYFVAVPCGDLLTFLRKKIEIAGYHGMLFVAAAGQRAHVFPDDNDNDKIPYYPSGFYYLDNVISVTAIDRQGLLNEANGLQSNYGMKSVHLGAPGAQIYSTDLPVNGNFEARSGTSMAAPFVSGAAALLLSIPGCSDLSAPQVREKILAGTVRTEALVGKTSTNGRLNIYEAIKLCAK